MVRFVEDHEIVGISAFENFALPVLPARKMARHDHERFAVPLLARDRSLIIVLTRWRTIPNQLLAIIDRPIEAGDIAEGSADVDTLNPNAKLKVTKDSSGVTVAASNSAKVASADVAADNGVIHVIDAVLLP